MPSLISGGVGLLAFAASLISLSTAQNQPLPCQRWAQMTTIAASSSNSSSASTLWIYGGNVKTSSSQTSNLYTNALLALDLSTSWNAGSPSLTLVASDSGNPYNPPAVALGSLWSSGDGMTLYQYGGSFSANYPAVSPGAVGVVAYGVKAGTWSNATTSGDMVVRASEGAAAVVPGAGTNGTAAAYYFSGHLDWASIPGWSTQTRRIFLDSMVRLDLGTLAWTNFTSYSNNGPTSDNATAETAPTERADGTLTFVPNLGTGGHGVLVAIGGGVNFQSTDANTNRSIDNSALDVFDIGSNSWTKQATQGSVPSPRVNHCAVRGTAKINGQEKHQVFVYGGQIVNGTAQSSDLYILDIPSYTWTFVGNNLASQPTGRAGHTCDLVGSQLIVIGGYISSDLLCDSQSVYVLDTGTLQWQTKYSPGTLYKTPSIVSSIAGGIGTGSSTSSSGSTLGGDGTADADTSSQHSAGGGSSHVGAIVGGVVGGVVALLLLLLSLILLRRKKRQKAEAAAAAAAAARKEKGHERMPSGLWGSDSGGAASSDEVGSGMTPYEKMFRHYPAASDDPEGETNGMDAQFSTRLAPRQQLRVVNPENDD